jgi:prephenate dehydrogenase
LIFCVYAKHIPAILKEHAHRLKPGSVVSDICGVKVPLYDTVLPLLPEGVAYIGLHPMAGKERDGYENAETGLYRNSGFLITPTEKSTPESTALAQELASYIGATRLQIVEPAEHDAIIAYTSDLMHVAAVGLCLNPPGGVQPAFCAGAFRDCTRVANINAEAWAELLMDNRHNTADVLEQYIANLQEMNKALRENDSAGLREALQRGGDKKRGMLYK